MTEAQAWRTLACHYDALSAERRPRVRGLWVLGLCEQVDFGHPTWPWTGYKQIVPRELHAQMWRRLQLLEPDNANEYEAWWEFDGEGCAERAIACGLLAAIAEDER